MRPSFETEELSVSQVFPPAWRRSVGVLVAVLSAALMVAGGMLLAAKANAALIDVPPTGAPGRLVLSSEPYPAEFLDISPGEAAFWQVGARLEDASRASLALELRKEGELVEHPRGLTMSVAVCDVPWSSLDTAPICTSGERAVAVATPADDFTASSPVFELRPLTPTSPEYLLVTLSVDDDAAARADTTLMGLTGRMGVGLTAVAMDRPADTPGAGGLAVTGADAGMLLAVAAIAAGLLGLGAALRLCRQEVAA